MSSSNAISLLAMIMASSLLVFLHTSDISLIDAKGLMAVGFPIVERAVDRVRGEFHVFACRTMSDRRFAPCFQKDLLVHCTISPTLSVGSAPGTGVGSVMIGSRV
jgi:hypothetical protein